MNVSTRRIGVGSGYYIFEEPLRKDYLRREAEARAQSLAKQQQSEERVAS